MGLCDHFGKSFAKVFKLIQLNKFKTFSLLVDVTAYHRGFHGDLNETLFVGQVSESAKKLVQVTWECLEKAIEIGS